MKSRERYRGCLPGLSASGTVGITERSGHQIDKMISGKSVER